MPKKQNKTYRDPDFYTTNDLSGKPKVVDFNYLLKKVKENNKKEKKKNIMVAGAAIATVVIAGVIISF